MKEPEHIAVLLGGPSAEREVSLRSGAAVAQALRSVGYRVAEIDPARPGWVLPAETQVALLALHGTYGEDGTVQRELEAQGVVYTGCDPEASRVAFDKVLSKERFVAAGVPTAPYTVVMGAQAPWPEGWQPPMVLKPARQGSSVGLRFVRAPAEWPAALAAAAQYDDTVLVEAWVTGRETTVGILDGQALPVVEIRPRTGVYDYQSKYTTGASEYLCPAPFPPELTRRIQQAGLDAFAAVGGRDYGRVDILVTPDGAPVVLEVNTLPGMTETSLLPKAAAAAGLGYAALCQAMIRLAWRRARAGARPPTLATQAPTVKTDA